MWIVNFETDWSEDWSHYGGLNSLNSLSAAQPLEIPSQNQYQALAEDPEDIPIHYGGDGPLDFNYAYDHPSDYVDEALATMMDFSMKESYCNCQAGCSHAPMPEIDEAFDQEGFQYVSKPGWARKFGNVPPRRIIVGSTPWSEMMRLGCWHLDRSTRPLPSQPSPNPERYRHHLYIPLQLYQISMRRRVDSIKVPKGASAERS